MPACLRSWMNAALVVLVGSVLAWTGPALAQDDSWKQSLGDDRELSSALREEILQVPVLGSPAPARLVATLYRPAGDSPRGLIVLSHGSPGKAADRVVMGRYRLLPQIGALVQAGYAVLVPMRRGYGATGGDYAESFGSCGLPRYDRTGEESARDLASALAYARTFGNWGAERVILMGQSAGGFAALATAALAKAPGVAAVVNLSGGRGGDGVTGIPCAPEAMEKLLAGYGAGTRVPVLWIYVENDKYFGPSVVRRWFDAYRGAGAPAELVMLPPHGADGHLLFYDARSIAVWLSRVEPFLGALRQPAAGKQL